MTRPGEKSEGYSGPRPSGGNARLGNNPRGREHPSTTRKPNGPKAS
ncbi:hypothetical protein ACI2LJ_37535 [Streptomyces sp. NPDC088090]